MCIWCMLERILFSGKEGQKYFFSLALNNDKFLYGNEYKALDIYRETEIQSSVLMKSSLFMEFFLLCFCFQI